MWAAAAPAVMRITADRRASSRPCRLGVTLTSLGIGALGEPVLSHVLDDWLAVFAAARLLSS